MPCTDQLAVHKCFDVETMSRREALHLTSALSLTDISINTRHRDACGYEQQDLVRIFAKV